MVNYKGKKILITGDLDEEGEKKLLQKYSGTNVLKADISNNTKLSLIKDFDRVLSLDLINASKEVKKEHGKKAKKEFIKRAYAVTKAKTPIQFNNAFNNEYKQYLEKVFDKEIVYIQSIQECYYYDIRKFFIKKSNFEKQEVKKKIKLKNKGGVIQTSPF